jgi:hypothetical protein
MYRVLRFATIALGSTLALASGAQELRLGWQSGIVWDSNIFYRSSNEQSDFSYRIGPDVDLSDHHGVLTYDLSYRLRVHNYFQENTSEGYDHFGDGNATWQITPRTSLSLSETLAQTSNSTTFFAAQQPTSPNVGAGELLFHQNKIFRSFTALQAVHEITPRLRLVADVDGFIYQFQNSNAVDSQTGAARLQLIYGLTSRTTIGIGATLRQQNFDAAQGRTSGTSTTFYQSSLIWEYRLSPTLTLNISAGPALVDPGQPSSKRIVERNPTISNFLVAAGSCPQTTGGYRVLATGCQATPVYTYLPTGQVYFGSLPVTGAGSNTTTVGFVEGEPSSSTSVTYFGNASIAKTWERGSLTLAYDRSASASSGLGTSTNLDVVSLSGTWHPTSRWTLGGIALWTHQVSSSDIPVTEAVVAPTTVYLDQYGRIVTDPTQATFRVPGAAETVGVLSQGKVGNALDIQGYRFTLHANRRLTPRFEAYGTATWWQQEHSGSFSQAATVNDLRFELGFIFHLDPIEL